MFRKFMTFVAVAAAALSLASCEKDPNALGGGGKTPVIEFEKTLYTVYDNGTVDVVIKSTLAAAEPVTIPVTFSGKAEKGVDYEVVARDAEGKEIPAEDAVTIEAGEAAGAITIKNISLTEEKNVSISFTVPEGYAAGTKKVAVVSPDTQEALVYSFQMARGYALESFVTTIEVVGTVSGKDFNAAEDIIIPLSLTGEGASVLQFVEDKETEGGASEGGDGETENGGATVTSVAAPAAGPYAVLKAGQAKATVKFTVPEGYSGDKEALLTVDTNADSRFIEGGDNEFVSIAVRGLQTPDKLVGTWKFSKVYSEEELISNWVELFEVDESEVPCKNDGFTLTFTKEGDGSVKLSPSGNGDFANFFREATVTLGSPINQTKPSTTLGEHTSLDCNMFIQADPDGTPYQFDTYYKLSSANRAFSADTESLGESTIIFNLTEKGLVMEFRDYEGDYVDLYGEFDPDFFSIPSLFVKE